MHGPGPKGPESGFPHDHVTNAAAKVPALVRAPESLLAETARGSSRTTITAALKHRREAVSDARWGDPREHDTRDRGDELPRVYDPRDRDDRDPRDALMRDLDLPRSDARMGDRA